MSVRKGIVLVCVWFTLTCSQLCDKYLDIVFLLDGSDSVTQDRFLSMQNGLRLFVQNSNVNERNGVAMGMIHFSDFIDAELPLTPFKTRLEIVNFISSLRNDGGRTNAYRAVERARLYFSGSRPQADNKLILLVDGNVRNPGLFQSQIESALREDQALQVTVFMLGPDDNYDNIDEYKNILGERNVVRVGSFEQFANESLRLLQVFCPDEPPPTRKPFGPCDGCTLLNGVGFNVDPLSCDCYYRCDFDVTGNITTTKMCCGCGTYFDKNMLTCVQANLVSTCSKDPCGSSTTDKAPFRNHCRAYWTCVNGHARTTECCPNGQRFDTSINTCISDARGMCVEECPCSTTHTTPVCSNNTRPHDNDPNLYYELVKNEATLMVSTVLRLCPMGTQYNPDTCLCSKHVEIAPSTCGKDLSLLFEEEPKIIRKKDVYDIKDHARQSWVHNDDVVVNALSSMATFSGTSRILIPRYANHDFQSDIAISMDFIPTPGSNLNAFLLSNGDCQDDATIEIKLLTSMLGVPTVRGIVHTKENKYTVTVIYREGQRTRVYYVYDGRTFSLTVVYSDGVKTTRSVRATGDIHRTHCGLQIGYGKDMNAIKRYYTGQMDTVEMYVGCIPEEFPPQ